MLLAVAVSLLFGDIKDYKKSCELGDGESCANLGRSYYNGQGVRQSYAKAKEYYGKACDLEIEDGCKNYSILNRKGY
jgi:TPR repeat protein